MVIWEIVDAFVVFSECQNADVKALFILPGGPGFH